MLIPHLLYTVFVKKEPNEIKTEQTAELERRLREYSHSGTLPMHMPGHKRNISKFAYLDGLGAQLDITEIEGFDNLHNAEDVLKDLCERVAGLYGAKKSFLSVNGSTGGVLSAVCALTKRNDKVIIARNCHKSVFNAAEINCLRSVYVQPQIVEELGIYGSVSPEDVRTALEKNRDAKIVAITSPTYEGIISDVKSIAEIARSYGAYLFVDEAHGAHLGLSQYFPQSAVKLGADIVVQSFHKTLPALTQTAVLHICSDKIDCREIQRRLSVFQTSSPSYILLSSIDGCVDYLQKFKESELKKWRGELNAFYCGVADLKKLKAYRLKNSDAAGNTVFDWDSSKILISSDCAINGIELSDILRKRYKIECEMASANFALAMTGLGDDGNALKRLSAALITLDDRLPAGKLPKINLPDLPECGYYPWEVESECGYRVAIEQSAGKICAEYVWAYPPGCPVLVPGEIIDERTLSYIRSCRETGVRLYGTYSALSEGIFITERSER